MKYFEVEVSKTESNTKLFGVWAEDEEKAADAAMASASNFSFNSIFGSVDYMIENVAEREAAGEETDEIEDLGDC